MTPETYICFDYGEKRIGTAVGQTLTATASPLDTILVKNGHPDWSGIAELIQQWQPGALIVGQPFNMDGSRQALTDAAEKFAKQLENRFRLPVYYAEERLTSYEAKQIYKDDKNLDPVAAQIILESWMSEHNKNQSG